MTRISDSESNADDSKPPKKGLVIRPPRQPFELKTERLGSLSIGHLSMKALTKVSPDLDLKNEISDNDVIKSLFLAVALRPPISDADQAAPLTIDEANQISEKDLQDFAKAFLEVEKWEVGVNESVQPHDSVTALAKKIRSKVDQVGESTKKMMDQVNGVLSPDTKRLFMMNTAISERLKEISGLGSIGDFMKDHVNVSALTAASQFSKDYERYAANGLAADLLRDIPDSVLRPQYDSDFSDSLTREIPITPINLPHPDEMPLNRAVKSMADLNKKADSLKETAGVMASAIGVINEAVAKALIDFKTKQLTDDAIQQKNLKTAVHTLIASVVVGGVSVLVGVISLYFSWKSYEFAANSNMSSPEQKSVAAKPGAAQLTAPKALSTP